ncbi:polyunsaturated fatty acid lipoxygenase ALOX15B-like [Mixophyes fleayi]|uniref:polyunsaturated fatty acid lipoxygenase ALOX15B-like n=1 Tax=Mixophyes fleayi TaxID=3061075 RepID=UPI003F4DF60F
MGIYKLKIATGTDLSAGTCDQISIVLVGVQGESEKHQLPHKWNSFRRGAVTDFDVDIEEDLGELLLVRLSKEQYKNFNVDAWYCQFVNVTCPNGQLYQFPYYRWISGLMTVEIPEGKGIILSGNIHPLLQQQRRVELEKEREKHKWKTYVEGIPRCIDVEKVVDLPPNDQLSFLKRNSIAYTKMSTDLEMNLEGFTTCEASWTDLEDTKFLFSLRRSDNSDVVAEIWKEDQFFGSQYLNGLNPTLIKKCFKIPENFPVNANMVAASLGSSTNLHEELENGSIFLADYKLLQGIPANNSINGKQQYIAAPMCLLWKNPQNELVPIAIQLAQNPGKNAPIFLPNDSESDWLLAKIWVRNSDFQVHQLNTHLLRTHFIAEVFNIATTRQLPMGHPVYKLIIPHLCFTLEINIIARSHFLGSGGIMDQAVVVGKGGVPILLKRAMDGVTYSSLCLPDDIKERGLESIPNYLYRDDGMKIWLAVESFVSNIIHYYYQSDELVSADPELQAWVAEIFKEGFLESKSSGIPSSLETKNTLIKYLTMVIFMCSAQHSAISGGLFDFYAWMPNGPTSMKIPPPTAKGISTTQTILDALPAINTTSTMNTVWLLRSDQRDTSHLGDYSDVRFTEKTPQKFIKDFQDQLAEISKFIKERNKSMCLPYYYLDPRVIENSVSN